MEAAGDHQKILKKLRAQISKRWPESLPENFDNFSAIPTNIPDFDSILPKGGLPAGELIQISGARSSGKTYFLFKLLSGLNSFKTFIVYFDLTGEISPQVVKSSGLNLKRFIHTRSENIQTSIRAAEVLLGAKETRFVVFDLVGFKDNIPRALLLRLKRVIKKSKGIAFFLTDEDYQSSQSSLIKLKLKVTRFSFSGISRRKPSVPLLFERLSVTLEKNPFGKEGKKVELVFDE